MSQWIALGVVGAAGAFAIGRWHEVMLATQLEHSLRSGPSATSGKRVDLAQLSDLPAPVARYFRRVLTDQMPLIKAVTLRQSGMLRTETTSDVWRSFVAEQLVVPGAPGFLWNAKVRMPLGLHVRVLDSYHSGMGSGRISFQSALRMAAQAGGPELDSSALQRYLAEAPWYPTALLPMSGVSWGPIDEQTALATVTAHTLRVSIEFRFDEADEVSGIYTRGRFRRVNGRYQLTPWEGHFTRYVMRSGVRVPAEGEAGWYDNGSWLAVWKGRIDDERIQFE